jgi:hypothetical protein
MIADIRIISLRPRGGPDPHMKEPPIKPVKYELIREDEYFWYGIPLNNLSAGERPIPKFVWKLCNEA